MTTSCPSWICERDSADLFAGKVCVEDEGARLWSMEVWEAQDGCRGEFLFELVKVGNHLRCGLDLLFDIVFLQGVCPWGLREERIQGYGFCNDRIPRKRRIFFGESGTGHVLIWVDVSAGGLTPCWLIVWPR